MYAYGLNWRLTKHGRLRFVQRVADIPDKEIYQYAVIGTKTIERWMIDRNTGKIVVRYIGIKDDNLFIWAQDRKWPETGRRLVTVLYKYKHVAKGEQYVDLIADRLQSNNSSGVVLVHGTVVVPNQVP